MGPVERQEGRGDAGAQRLVVHDLPDPLPLLRRPRASTPSLIHLLPEDVMFRSALLWLSLSGPILY